MSHNNLRWHDSCPILLIGVTLARLLRCTVIVHLCPISYILPHGRDRSGIGRLITRYGSWGYGIILYEASWHHSGYTPRCRAARPKRGTRIRQSANADNDRVGIGSLSSVRAEWYSIVPNACERGSNGKGLQRAIRPIPQLKGNRSPVHR